jgi:PadR family transcriptional regulator PadR
MAATMPLIKGTLDILMLKALARGSLHGFEITCWLEDHSDGGLAIDDGALYQALHRMEERRLIAGEWGITENNRRARYYRLTAEGRSHLRTESAALVRYARMVEAILGPQAA